MKRRSHRPKRDREMEEIISRTRMSVPVSEYRAQRERDKAVLQERLRAVFDERRNLQQQCRDHSDPDPPLLFRGEYLVSSRAFEIIKEDISSYTVTLRAVKEELEKL